MKKIISSIFFFLSVAGCINNDSVSYTDEAETVTAVPKRIISLAPAITEELYILGAQDLLIANTFYCKRPEDAVKKKKVGNLKNFDIELIIELNPDLILCTSLANKHKINKLKQLGVKVIEFPPPVSFDKICENFLQLGQIIDKKETAERIIYDGNKKIKSIRKLVENLPKKKVFMQIGANPLVAVNKDYFINDYIRYSGGDNITGDSISSLCTRESVLVADPDVIIITDMGIASEEEKRIWERYTTLTAVKNRDIYIVDSDIFCNPTITTFLEALKITASLLHPELILSRKSSDSGLN